MDNRAGGHGYAHDALGDEVIGLSGREPAVADEIAPEDTAGAKPRRSRLRLPLLIGGLVVALAAGLFFYLHGGRFESTDNASVQAGQVAVSANVGGQVVALAVRENEAVRRGQLLFRIDPRPYLAAVEEAEAQLAQARTQIASRRADLGQSDAGIAAAQARLDYALAEAARQRALLGEGISSQNQVDRAALEVATARQAIATSRAERSGVRASLSGDAALPVDRQPAVRAARAALDRARLNLGYAEVRAPQDGIVTKVNGLQLGDYVTPGRQVFTLVGRRIWIEANFKESQLAHMRLGQPATVRVDAFPDRDLRARLVSFSPGTGNSFALLPAENATGNWVKVVQRLPVQLELDRLPAGLDLHAGLSAEVTVDTGHVRHLFGPATEVPPTPPR